MEQLHALSQAMDGYLGLLPMDGDGGVLIIFLGFLAGVIIAAGPLLRAWQKREK